MEKKTTKLTKELDLKKKMKMKGATSTPNENTYIATAQEQASRGDKKGAMETMQYSIKPSVQKEIAAQDSVRGSDVSNQVVKNVQKRMQERRAKKK